MFNINKNFKKKRNLIIIGVVIFLIVFSVTSIIKLNNKEITLAHKYDLDQLLKKAKSDYYQGNYRESIQTYRKILKDNQKNTKVRKNLAAVYEDINDYQAAIKEYQKIIDIAPKEYLVYYDLGELYYNSGKYQKALPKLQKAIDNLQNKEVLKSSYLYLAQIFREQAKYNLALDAVNRVLELDSNSAMGYYHLGQIRDSLGKTEAAISAYQQVLRNDGSFQEVHLDLAEAYFKLEKYSQAVRKYKKVLAENPELDLAQKRLETLKELKPELFKTPEKKQRDKSKERQKMLEKKVAFTEIEPMSKKEEIQKIKVGLAKNREYLAFRTGSKFLIKDKDNRRVLFRGTAKTPYQLKISEKGKIKLLDKTGNLQQEFDKTVVIETVSETAPILLHDVSYGQGYYWASKEDRQYRGKMKLKLNSNSFTVINQINLEGYLYSVVPSEMSASWPLEALKAQAVAARSYTLFHLGKHGQDGYDLCATVDCAVYRGITREHSRSIKAVNQTFGQILTHGERPINAVYSANAGGYTESSLEIWGSSVPYLQGVTTTLESNKINSKQSEFKEGFPLPPYELQSWLRSHPKSYSANMKYGNPNRYRWQRIIFADDIASKLDIGKIKKILPTARAVGGTVKALKIIGTQGEKTIKRGLRSFFGGLRSNRFFIVTEYDSNELPEKFIFYGGGWGHNVGMDQVAAANMAQNGYNYEQILLHFYTGVKLKDRY